MVSRFPTVARPGNAEAHPGNVMASRFLSFSSVTQQTWHLGGIFWQYYGRKFFKSFRAGNLESHSGNMISLCVPKVPQSGTSGAYFGSIMALSSPEASQPGMSAANSGNMMALGFPSVSSPDILEACSGNIMASGFCKVPTSHLGGNMVLKSFPTWHLAGILLQYYGLDFPKNFPTWHVRGML